jgi:crossover junction endodeoxyribonuclease RusA
VTTELVFTIPKSWWLSANGRLHWADKMRRTRALRQLAAATVRQHGFEPVGTVHVAAFIGYLTGGRADPANAAVVKPLLDGLVDAGLLVDDDSTHVIGPTFLRDPKSPTPGHYTVRLVLTPQEIPW